MKKELLFESMRGIDDVFLEHSEMPKKRMSTRYWFSAAACLCIIAATALILPKLEHRDTPIPPIQSGDSVPGGDISDAEPSGSGSYNYDGCHESTWQVNYNPAEKSPLSGDRAFVTKGYFTEDLSLSEIAAIEPGKRIEWMDYSGFAGFDGTDNVAKLLHVLMRVTTTDPDSNVLIWISKTPIENLNCCYALPGEPAVSAFGGVEFEIYEYSAGNSINLEAYCEQSGLYFAFEMSTDDEKLEHSKADFEAVLECFTYYSDGPDLSAVTAEYVPEWICEELTHAEALSEEDFGAYMIREIPANFVPENIIRFKNQHQDHLSGLWSSGYDDLDWTVRYFSAEDESRVTAAADTENYDLSLYPIPRAESVPSSLQEIVDNPIFDIDDLTLDAVMKRAYTVNDAGDSAGYRMRFCVRYGDILVEIRSKGVSPEWIYEQLLALK